MKKIQIYHQAKSEMAYAFDEDTIHISLKVEKGISSKTYIIAGDPFYFVDGEWKPQYNKVEMKLKYTGEVYDYFCIEIKPNHKRCKYAFIVESNNTDYFFGSKEFFRIEDSDLNLYDLSNYYNFPYINKEDIINPPKWVKDTIWYQIFPERFRNGNSKLNSHVTNKWNDTIDITNHMHFGGDLRGIIDSLEYISELGVSGIYFTPIFEATSSHKYDTVDYYKIDKQFGTNEEFQELIQKAHSLNIKVILDAVFNHCGYMHPYFQDVVKHGKQSKYFDCFHIHGDKVEVPIDKNGVVIYPKNGEIIHNYETFAFTPKMPKWNTNNKLVRDYLLDVAKYWIEEYKIDGWRLDVANEVSHDFWRDFSKVVRTYDDKVIVGENWDDAHPWIGPDQFDSVMNYSLLFPCWNYFGANKDKKINTRIFVEKINDYLSLYPVQVIESMYNLLECHDTARMLQITGNNKELLLLSYSFLLSLPGSPSIYYGSEIGLTGENDPHNRRCMIWDEKNQDKYIFNNLKNIIKTRKNYKVLSSSDIKFISNDDILIYIKQYKNQKLLCVFNVNENKNSIELPIEFKNKNVLNLLQNKQIKLESKFEIDAYSFEFMLIN